MSDDQALLAANEAFYQAFNTRNLKAMEAIWAKRTPIACIHPS